MDAFNKKALLVVDDSRGDVELLKMAFLRAGCTNPIVTLRDGEEAIDYLVHLLESDKSAWQSLPVAILTDLKMPRGNGFDLLEWIRRQAVLDHVLTVVITNSSIEEDVRRAFELGANFFLTKPSDFSDFVLFANNFLAWLRLNRYPEPAEMSPPWSLLTTRGIQPRGKTTRRSAV